MQGQDLVELSCFAASYFQVCHRVVGAQPPVDLPVKELFYHVQAYVAGFVLLSLVLQVGHIGEYFFGSGILSFCIVFIQPRKEVQYIAVVVFYGAFAFT